jgi:glutathione synthase/RimK-type ligase-like ATP-grasp enzyme
MRIAIATSTTALGNPGDRLLSEALKAECIPWDAPVDWHEFDAIAIRSCWDYHLRPAEFLAWLDSLHTTVINPPSLIRWNLDKRYLRRLGMAMPETHWLTEGESRIVDGAHVVKPFISASAHQTHLIDGGNVAGPAMVQRFVPEIEQGEWSVVFLGGDYSHAVLKRPAPGDFRVQMEFGGSVRHQPPPSSVLRFAEEAMRRLPEPAVFARVDIVVAAEGPLLMEIEVIEPELFLTPAAARRLAEELGAHVDRARCVQ